MSAIYVIERQYDYDTEPTIDVDLGYFTSREEAQAFIDDEGVKIEVYNEQAKSDPDYLQAMRDYQEASEKIRALGGHMGKRPPTPSRRHLDYSVEVVEIKART